MVSFDKAYDFVNMDTPSLMRWEDSHPISGKITVDGGGPTRYGISQRAFPAVDIHTLTASAAKALTRKNYWCFDAVPYQDVARKLLDIGFNLGLGTMCLNLGVVLKVHGENVPHQTQWTNEFAAAIGRHDIDSIMAGLRVYQLEHYIQVYNGLAHVPADTVLRALA